MHHFNESVFFLLIYELVFFYSVNLISHGKCRIVKTNDFFLLKSEYLLKEPISFECLMYNFQFILQCNEKQNRNFDEIDA